MQDGLLPLFPLQVVLLPGAQLPLHIFEERYKEMIAEVLRDKIEFGVVLANEKGIVNTGCTASVDRVLKEYPDGRLDILTRGRRRFEILLVNEERPFLRGAVEFFDDDVTEQAEPVEQKSFRLAEDVPDLEFRQTLLVMRSETDRMHRLAAFLPGFLEQRKKIQHTKDVAGRNGHGHKSPESS
jgi:Lon protease-like protein